VRISTVGAWVVLAVACKDEDISGGEVVLTDANNYTYAPTLALGDVQLPALADAPVDWSALTVDLRGRPVDPATIEQIYLVEFVDYTRDELIDKIEANDLQNEDTSEAYIFDNSAGVTSTMLSSFEILSDSFPVEESFVEDPTRVWLVSLINHPNGGNDVLQSKFLTPLDAETGTAVAFTNDCSTLAVDVNMDDPIPPVVPEMSGGSVWSLDWSEVTVDVNGRPWEFLLGDTLQIGWFDVASVGDVEAQFLRLDSEADAFYTMDVYGLTGVVDLSEAIDVAGDPFPGFTSDGIWVVAIACKECLSPAPMYLAVLDVPSS
jgi:hypothetical protein